MLSKLASMELSQNDSGDIIEGEALSLESALQQGEPSCPHQTQ